MHMSRHLRKLCLLASTAAALTAPAFGTILVNDLMTDTDRIGGFDGSSTTALAPTTSTPTSSNTQWVSNATNLLVASSSGMLSTMPSTGARMVTGYFPTVALLDGTTTTFKLDFTLGTFGATGNGLRFGLFDGTPAGLRNTDGFTEGADATFVGDIGYGFTIPTVIGGPSTLTPQITLRERTSLTSSNLLGANGAWSNLGLAHNATSGHFQANTPYSITATLTRSGSVLDINLAITGGNLVDLNLTRQDTSISATALNQISFRPGGTDQQFASINFTGLEISQIPEPASVATLAGLGVIGLALTRRRRSA